MRRLPTRLWVLTAALAALGALVLAGPAGGPRRQGGGQQDTWTGVERIVAVGDVHGDHDQFVKALRAAGVIDGKGDWIAGKAHLVQTGDVLDRAPDSRKAMDLLMKLEKQAAKAGGAVHALIGNHEAMVLLDDWRYLHPGEIEAFGGRKAFRKAMSAQGKYGKWIRGHNAAVKINDVLFVHAGITPACARMSLGRLNQAVRAELAKGDREGMAVLAASNVAAILNDWPVSADPNLIPDFVERRGPDAAPSILNAKELGLPLLSFEF